MKIKFDRYEIKEGLRKDKTVWRAFVIYGTKLEDGAAWNGKHIFEDKDNISLINVVKSLEQGERIDVKHVRAGNGNWKTSEIVRLAGAEAAGTRSGKKQANNNDQMTKEDWAEKNKIDALRIAKSVALKAAVDNTKVGSHPEVVLEHAHTFLPFLLDDIHPMDFNKDDYQGDADPDTDAGADDPLEPPF